MMGRTVEVLGVELADRDGAQILEVKVDAGDGDACTVEHFGPAGDDSPPLPEVDFAQLVETTGAGAEAAVGYRDTQNPSVAAKGERRLYARNAAGETVAVLWLKGDGTVVVTNLAGKSMEMAPNGDVTIKGNLFVEGEITAKSALPATKVKLSTHLHPTGVGPTSAPTPNT